jgi:alpha-L-fucosidase
MKTNMKTTPSLFLVAALLVLGMAQPRLIAQEPAAAPSLPPKPYPERLQWWAEARFGMFIHWGPVSLTGKEISWSRANTNPKCPNKGEIPAEVYDHLYQQFNPTNFDANAWMGVAKSAGMKYFVLTAKHCDGFLLWHSQTSDYNIAATPFKRDICAELSTAARKQGVKVGWYFSPPDWRDPDFRTERNAAFVARMQDQLRELLTRYGKIDLLWFDYDCRQPLYDQENTYQLVRRIQPGIIIDNRLDLGAESNRLIKSRHADYYTPEQELGIYDDQTPWEACMTLSSRNAWAWGGASDGVKSLDACLNMLISCAGGDGNILLNVGPMPNGEIPPDQVKRLNEIGAWLEQYGESIYGTRGGPFKPGEYGVSTRKGSTIYLHIKNWDEATLRFPAIPAKVLKSRVLTGGKAVVRQTATGIEVSVLNSDRHPVDTIVALELDGDANRIPAVIVPGPASLATNAKATASNVYQNLAEYGADKSVDMNPSTRWATDAGVKTAWLELDLGKPVTFNCAVINEAFPELQRVRKFAIEYLEDGQWKSCYQGEKIGAKHMASFSAVTAQRVRLNITESTDGPTISEFQLREKGKP